MKIYTATADFLSSIRELFSGSSVEVLTGSGKEVADLIIFTGGEDINPETYGLRSSEYYNDSRDRIELSLARNIYNGTQKTKKVLGICRGLQLLNIAFGGSLVQDIAQSYGRPHPPVHPITWMVDSPLNSVFPSVNSLHHQAIKKLGMAVRPVTMAVEPSTNIIETILWGNVFLATQWHPEWIGSAEKKKEFNRIITDWVMNDTPIINKAKLSDDNAPHIKYTEKSLKGKWSVSVNNTDF